jgi:hypothetical protein
VTGEQITFVLFRVTSWIVAFSLSRHASSRRHSSYAIFRITDATNYLSYYLHTIYLDIVVGPIIALLECPGTTRRVLCGE